MRARFRGLRVSDFYEIEAQPRHAHVVPLLRANPLLLQSLVDSPFSFTMTVDGKPKASLGVLPDHKLWALLGDDLVRHFVRLTRYTRAMMDMYQAPLWADVDRTNPAAVKWALLLGMRKVKIAEKGTLDVWHYASKV